MLGSNNAQASLSELQSDVAAAQVVHSFVLNTGRFLRVLDWRCKQTTITSVRDSEFMSKVSLEKDKIRILLLEGVHQSALETLKSNGYSNIEFLKTSLPEDEL
ncbi:uncharacterized protein METZ01_LOCUS341971, partial [marine metagenome]